MNLRKSSQRSSKSYLSKKYGIIIIAIVSIGLFFIGINFLAYRYNQRWDVTKAKQHTLTGSTVNLIKTLKQEVQLTAFYVGMPPKYLEDLFKEYERFSTGKINARRHPGSGSKNSCENYGRV